MQIRATLHFCSQLINFTSQMCATVCYSYNFPIFSCQRLEFIISTYTGQHAVNMILLGVYLKSKLKYFSIILGKNSNYALIILCNGQWRSRQCPPSPSPHNIINSHYAQRCSLLLVTMPSSYNHITKIFDVAWMI